MMISRFWGKITGPDKGKKYPEQQGVALGRTGNWTAVFPRGFYSAAPVSTLFKILSPGAMMPVTVDRPDDVAEDETCIFHPATKSRIILRNNGDIDVLPEGDGKVNLGSGGAQIARLGDEVTLSFAVGVFTDSGGDTSPTAITEVKGTITAAGENTST